MSEQKKKQTKCPGCSIPLKKLSGYKKSLDTDEEISQFHAIFDETVDLNTIICSKCFSKMRKFVHQNKENQVKTAVLENAGELFSETPPTETQSSLSSTNSPGVFYPEAKPMEEVELVEMSITRTLSTHAYCCLCKSIKSLVLVPDQARMQVYAKKRIYIPNGNRCCIKHLINKRFYDEELKSIEVFSSTSMIPVPELSKLLEQLSIRVDSEIHDRIGDYSFPEERLNVLTAGLSWENIIELRDMMISLRDSESRNVTQALIVFLFKLVSGNSNKVICAVLGVQREQQVSAFCQSILTAFEKDVLPTRFGIGALSREELISHNTPVAKALHNIREDQLALIGDGTYLRHEKSANNEYQRKSFSGQKKVPLCKPFMICALYGYIIDSAGPFEANLNDARILDHLLKKPDGLRKLMISGDIWVLDRGFRDVKDNLESMGYKILMPALKGKQKQLTRQESNDSRFVTAVRWPVEVVHGVIGNKYKLLRHKFYNTMLPKAGLYCKIACFLQNKFGKRFVADPSMTDEIVSRMLQRKDVENTLASEAENGHWSRRKLPFRPMTSSDVLDFPELTERDLKILFSGTYQLQQSVSYLAEMMNEDGELELYYLKATNEILKVRVKSRHVNRNTYNCFVHYRPQTNGCAGIVRYCCECANGNRTIGCCAHVAAVIYYLSHGRYLAKIIQPAKILSSLFAVQQVPPVINEDSDED
ncbi:uncharacterized protein LOC131672915 [Phymastichus coffea]|uniref:uncharacterized protein LOC131672915 n=1 Tax=Phymastichus coffea TaxID=108790 RepID=UPI00273BE97B|nr:uncharacterized protein LOC131672915 [Phymastichus coffea]